MTNSESSQFDLLECVHNFVVAADGDDELTEERWTEFEQLLRKDDEACQLYVEYMDVSVLVPYILDTMPDQDLSFSAGSVSEIPAPPAFLPTILPSTIGLFSEGWAVSYLLATVITGLLILGFWLMPVSRPGQVARQSDSLPSPLSPLPSFVGRITGLVDCIWGQSLAREFRLSTLVSLGDKIALASGLMEITYDTGAKVLLQGPVTYEVESNGGYLSLGKLTGKREHSFNREPAASVSVASKSEIRNPKSEISSPQPLAPGPFVIHTSTTTVTDLGTEFGVEVDRQGGSHVETFVGAVMVAPAVGGKSTAGAQLLVAGKAIRIDITGSAATASTGAVPFLRSIREKEVDPYAKAVLADRPLAYWPLDEAPGARWITDHSGSRCSGRVVGTIRPAQPGPFQNTRSHAIEFTGNGYIEINQSPYSDPAKGFSIEAWARWDGGDGPQSIITDRSKNGGYMLYARPEPGLEAWDFSSNCYGAAIQVPDGIFHPIVKKRWTHLVGTFEPTGGRTGDPLFDALVGVRKLYVNGDLVAAQKGRFAPEDANRVRIGAGATESPQAMYFFIGRIAEVAIYDRPLGADRVKAHYEAGSGSSKADEPFKGGPEQRACGPKQRAGKEVTGKQRV